MPSSNLLPFSRITLSIDSETAEAVAEVERKIWLFSHQLNSRSELAAKAFYDSCLHVESIANIKMTGKQTSVRDVFRAAATKPSEIGKNGEKHKQESLRNIDALLAACSVGKRRVTVDSFYEIHRQLLTGTTREPYRGVLRAQNQKTGGGRYQSFGMSHEAPRPEDIPDLLADLAAFCNQTTIPAVAQAALAHVQFLAIHPFERANGKTARSLVQLVLQHRQLIDRKIPPLSLALALSPHEYREGVIATMKNLERETPNPAELNAWVQFFATCCARSIEEAETLRNRLSTLLADCHARVGARSDSASTMIIDALPGMPVFSANMMSSYIERSFKRVSVALDELVTASVVKQITEGKRNRVFECPAVVDAYAHIPGFQ